MRAIRFLPYDTNYDFIGKRTIAFIVAGIILLGSILLIPTRGLNFGIDFQGGVLMEVRTPGPADLATMRTTLSGLGLGEVSLQEFGAPNDVLIRIQRQEGGDEAQMRAVQVVREALGEAVEYRRVEVVGPTVGRELVEAGIMAMVLAVVAISFYIWFRFEWQFGVGAAIASVHDVVATIGLFSLLQLEFNLTSVAAILTVTGYSINDTVVVYDRIRENLRKYKAMALPDLLNRSVNEMLARTLMTSGTTLLAGLSLYIFGGEVLRGFSLALIWGILIGTFSSIYIAAPVLLYTKVRRGALSGDSDAPADAAAAKKAP